MDEITKKMEGVASGDQSPVRTVHVKQGFTDQMSLRNRASQRPSQYVRSSSTMGGSLQSSMKESMQAQKSSGRMSAGDGEKSDRTANLLDKIVTVCIVMLFFGLPLFFINLTYQGINFEKQYYFYIWSFFGIVAMIARGMLGGKIEFRRTSLDMPLAVLWIATVVSTVFSVDKYHSVFGFFDNPISGLISVTALILTYYLIVSHITKGRIMLMWWTIVVSGGIVTVWSFLATMRFVPQSVFKYIIASLTGSFTSLAVFLGMMLPMFIISFAVIRNDVRGSMRAKMVAFSLIAFIILDALTLSALYGYVRWMMILVAMAVLLIFMISRSVKVTQSVSTATIIIFLALFGLMSFGQPLVMRTSIQPEAMIDYRLSFNIAMQALKNRPIFGSGPSTYGYDFSLYRPKELNGTGQYDIRFFSDRGMLLESVSTLGIVGAVVLVVIFLTYIGTIFHAFMRTADEEIKVIALGLFVASAIAMAYALFWAVDGVIIIYGILLGAFLVSILRSDADARTKITLSTSASPQHALSFAFVSILIAVGMIFGFVTLGKMFIADVHAGNALRARAAGDYEKSSDLFQKAVLLNGKEGRYYTVISQYGLDLANMESAKPDGERNDENTRAYITGATGTASVGRDLMPNDVLANETKGFIFENSGGYVGDALNTALDAYAKASRLEPQNPYLDVAIGKLKLVEAQSKGEGATEEKKALINEAKGYFEGAREKTAFERNGKLVSVFAPAHYYISVCEEAMGNTDAAIDSMTTALQVTSLEAANSQEQITSRQINYGFNLARLLQVRGTDDDMALAEKLLLQIIGVNDQEVNSHLNLGLLYERTGRKDQAVEEYKKILAILPEGESKARENIQQLIDTVAQGGSNIDAEKKSDNVASEDKDNEKDVVKPSILIVKTQGGDQAQGIQDTLKQDGYKVDLREEEDRVEDGVVIQHKGSVDGGEVKAIEADVKKKYATAKSERNDQDASTYNYDVVIVVGTAE